MGMLKQPWLKQCEHIAIIYNVSLYSKWFLYILRVALKQEKKVLQWIIV